MINLFEQPHPKIEHFRRYFETVVETAKNKARIRQLDFRTRRRALGDRTLRVIGLVSVGQINNAFGIRCV